MAEPHVISALVRKRAELVGELRAAEDRTAELRRQLSHLDETLRLFKPDARLEDIPARRLPHCSAYFRRGDLARLALATVRGAERPLTAREIARRVMAERSMNGNDRALLDTLAKSVGQALRRWRGNGIESAPGEGQTVVWWIRP